MKKNNELEKYLIPLEKKLLLMAKGESSGHDINHFKRVLNLALTLQKKEGGDKLVIGTAAFLHDVHRLLSKKGQKFCEPKESLPIIEKMLEEVKFPEEKKKMVLHSIEHHEEYGFIKGERVSDLETLILQDADNLDAIGAVGIGRTFSFSGVHEIPMWRPEVPFKKNFQGEHIYDSSTMHHIYAKLLQLKENMNTKTAKAMAKERHKYMEAFFQRFIKEWQGKI